jgi:hypothetical protein
MEKHHDPNDETVTHFRAIERKDLGGYFITLYRFREFMPAYGQTECNCTPELKARNSICFFCLNKMHGLRPQYKGPLGWKFHSQQSDADVLPHLHPIEELPEITGDNLVDKKFNPASLYAG